MKLILLSLILLSIALADWASDYEEGKSLLEKGSYSQAIEYFKDAIDSEYYDDKSKRVSGRRFIQYFPHRELGVCYYNLGRYDDAIRELNISKKHSYTSRANTYISYSNSAKTKTENTIVKKEKDQIIQRKKDTEATYQSYFSGLTEEVLLHETFSINANNWIFSTSTVKKKKKNFFKINDGVLKLDRKNNKKAHHAIVTADQLDYLLPFKIEAKIKFLSGGTGNTTGLVFGSKYWGDRLLFHITANGSYKIFKTVNSKYVTIVDYTKSKKLYTGKSYNKLEVYHYYDKFLFYINGSYITSVPFELPKYPSMGIENHTDAVAEIDDFKVTQYYDFERSELPPILSADLSFTDDNGNGLLEAFEKATITVNVQNTGKGNANNLVAKITTKTPDKALKITSTKRIKTLKPGMSESLVISLEGLGDLKTSSQEFEVVVTEFDGYDMDPAKLHLETKSFDPPKLILAGYEIIDSGSDVVAIKENGQLEAGESVYLRLHLQNTGLSDALNVRYNLNTTNKRNIRIGKNNSGTLAKLAVGQVKTIDIRVSPNKRVDRSKALPIFFTATEETNKGSFSNFQVQINIDKKPPAPTVIQVKNTYKPRKNNRSTFTFAQTSGFSLKKTNVINIRNVPTSRSSRPNAIAVIIGVENYDNIAPAPYASNDAKLMNDYFEKTLGIKTINLKTDSDVRGIFFKKMFDAENGELAKYVEPGVTEVFIYYSGHGIPNKSGDKTYLFPSDGDISFLADQGYSLDTFYENLNKLGAKHTTVILDACFSGVTRPSESLKAGNLVAAKGLKLKLNKPWLNFNNFTVINSSTGQETSLGFDDASTGLFTYYFTAGLKGKADSNDDRKITLGELKKYVIENVTKTSKRIWGLQTPQFTGNETSVLVEF